MIEMEKESEMWSMFKRAKPAPVEPALIKHRDPKDPHRVIEWPEAYWCDNLVDGNGMDLYAVRLATGYLLSSKEYRRV